LGRTVTTLRLSVIAPRPDLSLNADAHRRAYAS
jgi:hypothetical protein